MIFPAWLLAAAVHTNQVRLARDSSVGGYILIGLLFVLVISLVLAVHLLYVLLTDETGKPYDPYDPYDTRR